MKTNRLILTVVTLIAAAEVGLGTVGGATNDVSGLLQKGLFEEEANHNLDAAIQAYEGVVTQTEKNRQFAATAVFRLGECYRKQGKTNEANAQYQKILRDFPDQAELAKLAAQQLGSAAEPAEGGDGADGLLARLQKRRADELESKPLADIKKLSSEKRRVAVQQMFPNPVLNSLMQKMTETEQDLAKLKSTLGENHPDVTAKTAVLKSIYQQIDDQVDAALSGRSKSAEPTAAALSQDIGPTAANEIKQIQAVIKDSPDRINARGDMGRTPLCQAVRDNHLKPAEFLLENKADTEIPDNFAKTPLIIAAEAGRGEMVKLLLEHGADANAPVRKEKVALNHAINKGDDGLTALHYAAFYGYKGVAEALLAHGANMEARNEENKTPLHMAAAKGFKSVAELLLAHKANVEAQRDTGATALHEAAYAGNKAIVELLLANHANLNARDGKGATALFMTADTGYPAITELLIAQGADLNLDQQGMTPLMEAIAQNRTDVAKLLIQHGADVKKARPTDSGQSWAGATALSMAIEKNQPEIMRLLLDKGADVDSVAYFFSLVDFRTPNAGSYHYGTPLMQAVYKNDLEAIQLLLEHKANVSFSNTNGETPLLVAVQGGHKELVELLLDHHADVNAVDARGWSLLHHAVGNGQMDMAGLLLDRGVKVNIENYSGDTAIDLVSPHEKGPYTLAAVFSTSPMPPPPRSMRNPGGALNPEYATAAMLALLRAHGATEPKIGDLEIISARLDAPNKSLNITDEVRKLLSSEDSRFLAQSGSVKAGNVLVPGLKEDPAQGMLVAIDYKFKGKPAEVVVSQPENLVTFWRLVDEAKRQNVKKP